ncbi:peptidoglycan editing factor PgeF [Sneathiella aquimaris]|uniref:peptidoglycan editing factor PgeF n=1 Tax=Sneathiella aquimaris TaxID=2599305 RepID=UPI00146C8A19|nr:peptidoglycan editing factor PgeF [Sneathiella aquimaris]
MIKSDIFNESQVSHGFFTRKNGVSNGIYASLNCGAGSNDAIDNVIKNKEIVAKSLLVSPENLTTLYQVHSSDVLTLTEPVDTENKPKADAMVTNVSGLALGILTADCVPILFADSVNQVIGAAHSGWKGTIGNISKAVIEAMIELGASRSSICCAIGPAIQQASYEVGPDFPAPFIALDPAYKSFFIPSEREKHHMFDLTGFVKMQLLQQNIKAVDLIDNDTCADEEYFYSYRRMCKRGEPDYGRQISAIALRPQT